MRLHAVAWISWLLLCTPEHMELMKRRTSSVVGARLERELSLRQALSSSSPGFAREKLIATASASPLSQLMLDCGKGGAFRVGSSMGGSVGNVGAEEAATERGRQSLVS